MKKFFLIIPVLLLFLSVPLNTFAESPEEEFSGQIDGILSDYDIGYSAGEIDNLSFGGILGIIRDALAAEIAAPVKMLGTVMIVTVFTAVMKSAGESAISDSNLYNMICVISAVTVTAPQLLTVYGKAQAAIERGGGFILVFVPVFTGITVACGGITSAGVYHVMILAASELIVRISESFLMPVLSLTAVLAVTGSIFPNSSVDGIVQLIRKIVVWGITVVMSLFTGFVTLKCTIAGKADGFAAKTAKFMISGFVPIVGGAVSDAYSTVRGSFDIIRSTVGIVGVFAIFLILLIPVLELMIFRAVMWIGTAAAEIFSTEPIVRLLRSFDSGIAIAQSVLVCHALIFVLCSAILMQAV